MTLTAALRAALNPDADKSEEGLAALATLCEMSDTPEQKRTANAASLLRMTLCTDADCNGFIAFAVIFDGAPENLVGRVANRERSSAEWTAAALRLAAWADGVTP